VRSEIVGVLISINGPFIFHLERQRLATLLLRRQRFSAETKAEQLSPDLWLRVAVR
jgi:hypothetical protein